MLPPTVIHPIICRQRGYGIAWRSDLYSSPLFESCICIYVVQYDDPFDRVSGASNHLNSVRKAPNGRQAEAGPAATKIPGIR